MFKLGEYEEFEAADIAAHLKGAGVKVDLKPVISASVESAVYLEGKESELRERIEEFEVYDRYIEALKAALAEGVEAEEFTDRYLSLLDPSWKEKEDGMAGFLEDGTVSSEGGDDSPEGMVERAKDLLEMLEAIQFMGDALNLNDIEIGGEAGAQMGDDPVLRIPVDVDEVDPDDELARPIPGGPAGEMGRATPRRDDGSSGQERRRRFRRRVPGRVLQDLLHRDDDGAASRTA